MRFEPQPSACNARICLTISVSNIGTAIVGGAPLERSFIVGLPPAGEGVSFSGARGSFYVAPDTVGGGGSGGARATVRRVPACGCGCGCGGWWVEVDQVGLGRPCAGRPRLRLLLLLLR